NTGKRRSNTWAKPAADGGDAPGPVTDRRVTGPAPGVMPRPGLFAREMRGKRFVLGLAGTMALAPFFLLAQQKPIAGCNAALNCRNGPLGYLARGPGENGLLFGAGIRFGPGFQFFLVKPNLAASPTPAPAGPMFHLR